jgi:uncharacterized protein (UPF0335 family)
VDGIENSGKGDALEVRFWNGNRAWLADPRFPREKPSVLPYLGQSALELSGILAGKVARMEVLEQKRSDIIRVVLEFMLELLVLGYPSKMCRKVIHSIRKSNGAVVASQAVFREFLASQRATRRRTLRHGGSPR